MKSNSIYLGLDIGGTKLAAVTGLNDGTILHRAEAPTSHGTVEGWRTSADSLIVLAQTVCQLTGVPPWDCISVGISCGGPLDSKTGVVLRPPNLPEWDNVPIRDFVMDRLSVRVVALENDANATAVAEHEWGAGVGVGNMAYLTFGTGMGAGLILDGKLFRGKRDFAGEIGHATIYPDGPICLCGKRGCLEAIASGGAIDRIGRERYGDQTVNAAIVCERARGGDAVALGIIDEASRALGIGIANLLQTLDLEMVILGSLALKAGDLFLQPVRRYAEHYAWDSVMDGVRIVPAGLGFEAQDKAALAVAINAAR